MPENTIPSDEDVIKAANSQILEERIEAETRKARAERENEKSKTKKLEEANPDPELVDITVTKFGAGKISTGEHVAGEGDIYADRGEKMKVAIHVARALEAKGLAETD